MTRKVRVPTMAEQRNGFVDGNPTYNLNDITGTNQVVLTTAQTPSHTHTNTAVSTLTPASHHHLIASMGSANETNPPTANNFIRQSKSTGGNLGYGLRGTSTTSTVGKTTDVSQNVSTTVTINPTGGGLPHNNYQPGIGAYYIIYIP